MHVIIRLMICINSPTLITLILFDWKLWKHPQTCSHLYFHCKKLGHIWQCSTTTVGLSDCWKTWKTDTKTVLVNSSFQTESQYLKTHLCFTCLFWLVCWVLLVLLSLLFFRSYHSSCKPIYSSPTASDWYCGRGCWWELDREEALQETGTSILSQP